MGALRLLMSRKKKDAQGIAEHRSKAALLLIDVINDFEFEGGEKLARAANKIAKNIAALKRRGKAAGIPVIYLNDNFGKWQSDFRKLVEHCGNKESRGRSIVERLLPEPDDYFVLKPKNSGFYSTALELLLRYLEARTLILCGLTADNCVLFTAVDAHMRDYDLIIPSDCVASQSPGRKTQALDLIRRVLDVEITTSRNLDLEELAVIEKPNEKGKR